MYCKLQKLESRTSAPPNLPSSSSPSSYFTPGLSWPFLRLVLTISLKTEVKLFSSDLGHLCNVSKGRLWHFTSKHKAERGRLQEIYDRNNPFLSENFSFRLLVIWSITNLNTSTRNHCDLQVESILPFLPECTFSWQHDKLIALN